MKVISESGKTFSYRLDGDPMPKQVPSCRRMFPAMSIMGKNQLRLAAILAIDAQLQLLSPACGIIGTPVERSNPAPIQARRGCA